MQIMEPREVLARLAGLPIRVFEEGDVVLTEGSATGRLLFLQHGAVDVVMDGVELSRITEPGAVFGDVALLLGQPHTADVRAVQPSSFYVVEDAEAFLRAEPLVSLYIAMVLASRLYAVNRLLIDARNQAAEADQRRHLFVDMINGITRALHIRGHDGSG